MGSRGESTVSRAWEGKAHSLPANLEAPLQRPSVRAAVMDGLTGLVGAGCRLKQRQLEATRVSAAKVAQPEPPMCSVLGEEVEAG